MVSYTGGVMTHTKHPHTSSELLQIELGTAEEPTNNDSSYCCSEDRAASAVSVYAAAVVSLLVLNASKVFK